MRRFKMNQLSMPGHCKKDCKEHELILRILKGIVSCRTLVIARRYKERERGLLPAATRAQLRICMRMDAIKCKAYKEQGHLAAPKETRT